MNYIIMLFHIFLNTMLLSHRLSPFSLSNIEVVIISLSSVLLSRCLDVHGYICHLFISLSREIPFAFSISNVQCSKVKNMGISVAFSCCWVRYISGEYKAKASNSFDRKI